MMRALILSLILAGCATTDRLPMISPCKPGDLMRIVGDGHVIDCRKTPHAEVPDTSAKPFPYGPKESL